MRDGLVALYQLGNVLLILEPVFLGRELVEVQMRALQGFRALGLLVLRQGVIGVHGDFGRAVQHFSQVLLLPWATESVSACMDCEFV